MVGSVSWSKESIHEAVIRQRAFFQAGRTLDVSWRIEQLKKLRNAVLANEKELESALQKDLGRHAAEAYFCDIGATVMASRGLLMAMTHFATPFTIRPASPGARPTATLRA